MSNTFKDAEGREWSLRITHGDLPPLRAAGFNPANCFKNVDQLDPINDPDVFGKVLWVLCGPQAEKKGVTPEQFAYGFDGPAVAAAADALLGALADFSLRPPVAPAAKARMTGATARAEQEMIRRLAEPPTTSGSTDSGGSSPGSPASTPGP